MDKDKFYKPNKKDMAIMKKIDHHHTASMNHSTGSPEHKHHIQQVMKHKSQLSKDAQKLLMMGEGTYKVEIEGLPKMYMDTDNPGELRRDLRKIVRKVDMVKNIERVQKSQVRKDLQLKIQGKDPEEIDERDLSSKQKSELDHLQRIHKHFSNISSNPTRKAEHDRVKKRIQQLGHKPDTISKDEEVEEAMQPRPRKGKRTPQELETMKLYNYAMKQKPGSPERKNVMNTLNRKRQEMGKPPIKELAMGQSVEVKRTKVGEAPKGIGWSLKKLGKHTGKDYDVWHRVTKPVAQPIIRRGSTMYSSKNESFFFVKEDQIKRDGAKIKKAYAAIATEDMNVITKHLKKQGIDHDHDRGELYVRRQDHRDVMNHLDDLMKKKMIKSKPPVTAENAFRPPHLSKLDVDHHKARELMSRAKHRDDGINRIMKGMKIDKAKATKYHDNVMKAYGFKAESDDYHYSTGEPLDKKLSPKAQRAKDAQARIDKKFGPGGSYSKGADQVRKVIAKEDTDFSKTIDIVRKHSKGSEIRGSGDGTTVTAEHPRGQNASKADRAAHTNMLKDKLKHLKSVKVVHKTYPGSATEAHSTKDILKMFPKPSKFSDKEVKMAKGIAFDKRYKGGDMDGAVRAQNKIKKGLSDHPAVARANRAANEVRGPFRTRPRIFEPKPDDSPERTAMIKSVQKSLNKRRERLAKAKKDRQAAWAQGKDFDTLKALGYGKAIEANEEKKKKTGLAGKAEKSGMPLGILKTVYNRGMAAWKTGHRPGTTPQQWGHARVNSFITKSSGTWGKADKDLADKVRARKK